ARLSSMRRPRASGTAGPNRPRARSQFSGRRPASSARQVVLSLAGVRGTRSSQPARYAPVRLTRGSTIETAAEKAGLAPKLLWIMLGTQLEIGSASCRERQQVVSAAVSGE